MTESEAGADEPEAATAEETTASALAPTRPPAVRRIPWLLVLSTFAASLAFYWQGEESEWRSVGFQLVGALVAFVGLAVALGREPGGWSRTSLWPAERAWFKRAMLVEFATQLSIASCVAIVAVAMKPFSGAVASSSGYWDHVGPVLPSDSWPSFARSVIAAPLCEEALVRGLLLGALAQRLPRSSAVLLSAVVFGLAHPAFWPQFLSGVLYGWLTLQCGSLWPAVFAHALGNGLTQPIAMAGLRVGEFVWRGASIPPALTALAGVLVVVLLLRFALEMAKGWRTPVLLARAVTVVAVAMLVWSIADGRSARPATAGTEVTSYVQSRWIPFASGKRSNSLRVQGELVPVALERRDTAECIVWIRTSNPGSADPLLESVRVRATLAGRPAIIGIERERHIDVRPLSARAFRTMRWLSEGDKGTELIGVPGRVVYGPERREGPLRVIEARVLDPRPLLGDQAEALVWVPVGSTCWQITAAVADSARVLDVLEALDERVARASADVEKSSDSSAAGPVHRSVLLSDLGRVPSFVRWPASRLPWLLLGALTCLVLAWVTVREHLPWSTARSTRASSA